MHLAHLNSVMPHVEFAQRTTDGVKSLRMHERHVWCRLGHDRDVLVAASSASSGPTSQPHLTHRAFSVTAASLGCRQAVYCVHGIFAHEIGGRFDLAILPFAYPQIFIYILTNNCVLYCWFVPGICLTLFLPPSRRTRSHPHPVQHRPPRRVNRTAR